MSRYAFGIKAAVRTSLLTCPECKASVYSPCMTWWNLLLPLGLVTHASRALGNLDGAHQ